jgi:hypothetical protein
MTISDIEVVSDTKMRACVYIENAGDEFVLTSYQCALSINQEIDLSSLSLTYVEESSELLNEPNLYVGIDNVDGPTELTFVSYIGSDIISSKKLVGAFILEGNIDVSNINLLNIQWDFEGTISTIITGEGFENITDPSSHQSIFSPQEPMEIAKVSIMGSEASAVYGDKFTDEMLFDGIHSTTNSGQNNSSSDGRWAVEGYPQWVTIDLGEETYIDHIRLDPYGSEEGINYDCEFYEGDYENKSMILSETTQIGFQWSEHSLNGIKTRYLTIVVTGSNENTWCDFWELEVYGYNSTTDVDQGNRLEEQIAEGEDVIPNEYGISQNYPNPFNPSTRVQISMKENNNVRLEVYNLLGERMISVINRELSAGIHEVSIDGSQLASGMYVYQLIVGNTFTETKKMQLMK